MGTVLPTNPGLEALLRTLAELKSGTVAPAAAGASSQSAPGSDTVEISAEAARRLQTETPAGL